MTIRKSGFQSSYECPECGKNLLNARWLDDHMAIFHPKNTPLFAGDEIVKCEFCSYHVQERNYVQHILRAHPEEQ